MSAWGWTGRVTLDHSRDRKYHNVQLDGRVVGFADHLDGLGWRSVFFRTADAVSCRDLPSLDAAVMWVLRRAAPKVWREERGPVWAVRPMWPVSAWRGESPIFRPSAPATRWLVDDPSERTLGTYPTWVEAMKAATS